MNNDRIQYISTYLIIIFLSLLYLLYIVPSVDFLRQPVKTGELLYYAFIFYLFVKIETD